MASTRKPGETSPLYSFADMTMPQLPDMEGLLGAYRRNIEVFTTANRIAMEGAQAVGRRNMEILQQTMTEMSEAMTLLSALDHPSQRAAKQTELARRAYERAVSNAKELSELIQRANGEAVEILNQRFMEAMEEIRALMEKAGGGR